jgi:hypothetical protein
MMPRFRVLSFLFTLVLAMGAGVVAAAPSQAYAATGAPTSWRSSTCCAPPARA